MFETVSKAVLVLGLLCGGCVAEAQKAQPQPDKEQAPQASATVQEQAQPPKLPERMRGLVVPTINSTDADIEFAIKYAAEHGANWIRLGLKPDKPKALEPAPTPEDPLIPYKKNLERIRYALELCKKYDLPAAIMVVPWGRDQDFFWQAEEGGHYREHLPQFWVAFAREFKDDPTLVAYCLMGEPNPSEGNMDTWRNDLLPKCIAAVRSVNRTIWLNVQPGPWGLPSGYEDFEPVDDPYVFYSFDAYPPHTYTHQGIKQYPPDQTYPGMLKQFPGSPAIMWDREQLLKNFAPAKAFADKYHVRMGCWEFGVTRWAPGREQWTRDMISVFEEYGFDWANFALNGWNGWNPTFGTEHFKTREDWWKTDGPLVNESPVLEAWKAGWALNKSTAPTQNSSAAKP